MRTRLVAIGNSRGIIIPPAIIERCRLGGEIEMDVQEDCVIVCSARKPRAGWEAAMERMHENLDDVLLDPTDAHAETDWERAEWEWK